LSTLATFVATEALLPDLLDQSFLKFVGHGIFTHSNHNLESKSEKTNAVPVAHHMGHSQSPINPKACSR